MSDQTKHMKNVDAFLARLRTFLSTPDHSATGGWPDIPAADMGQLHELLRKLTALKWAADADGDQPLRLTIVQRARQRLIWDMPVTHEFEGETPEQAEQRLLGNLRTISGAMSSYAEELRQTQIQMEHLQQTRLVSAAQFEVFLAEYERPEDYVEQFDRPAAVFLTEAEAKTPTLAGFTLKRVGKVLARPPLFSRPDGNYAEYRAVLKGLTAKVTPRRALLSKASLHSLP